MKALVLVACTLFHHLSIAQQLPTVTVIADSINASFRGLSVPSDDVIWVSGSNGTVGRSTDAGKTWKWIIVAGFEKRDFRDIEAFDSLTAIIIAVDNPAAILKTKNGGQNWTINYGKTAEGMFLDALDCQSESACICIGDPIIFPNDSSRSKFFVLSTKRYSDWWQELEDDKSGPHGSAFMLPLAAEGEAIFAASGTNIKVTDFNQKEFAFVSGGASANLHLMKAGFRNKKIKIPLMQDRPSAGAFSLYSEGKKKFYIAGGDYVEYWKDSGNVVYTHDAGKTWKRSAAHGYRSCLIQTGKKTFITCGTNGVDISFDGCKTFHLIHGDGAKGKDGFNVCAKSKTGEAVYFAGTGRIGKLIP